MGDSRHATPQEDFWAGQFGDDYVGRNQGRELMASITYRWTQLLGTCPRPGSILELGANIGLNMHALRWLLPSVELTAVEINDSAYETLARIPDMTAIHGSILDLELDQTFDLTFTSGVMINIEPDSLPEIYKRLYDYSNRFIGIFEYYNPTPVEVPYRGNREKLYKRDWAGDMLDRYPDLELRDYGFIYHRDPNFPSDDSTWFLLEKRGAS